MPLLSRVAFASLLACASLSVVGVSAAHAQANLTFSGGSGTPLTLTLTAPVTYTITRAVTDVIPIFIFDAVGDVFGNVRDNTRFTGTLTFSLNGGAPRTVDSLGSGVSGGDVTADDAYVAEVPFSSALAVGDQLVLSAGTLTTNGNIAAAAPAGGSFTTFIVENVGATRISSNGVSASAAAPEPGSIALLLTAGIPVVGIIRRRKVAKKN